MDPAPDDFGELFATLMAEHERALYRYILSLHPIIDEVDDLLQNTSLTLWRKFEEYDRDRPFLPWALRVAYFEVLRWRKHMRNRRFVLSDALVELLHEEVPKEVDDGGRQRALNACIAELSSEQRLLLTRRYGSSESIRELAVEVGLSARKLYYNLERLRHVLVICVERRMGAS